MESEDVHSNIKKMYQRVVVKKLLIIFSLAFMLLLLSMISLCLGSADIGFDDVFSAIVARFLYNYSSSDFAQIVVWELRIPRILMAIIAGASFASAGVVLQAILRNPLASPYTIGVASSAAFGASLAIVFGAGIIAWKEIIFLNPYLIAVHAFVFSIFSTLVIYCISRLKGAAPGTMILAGIAITYIFSAATSLLQYFATSEQVTAVVFWMFGDIGKADWVNLPLVAFMATLIIPFILKQGWDLNALLSGDEVAKSLGVNTKNIRLTDLVLSALLTSIPVSFIGTIGFVGLLAPHISRMIVGGDHRYLLPSSSILGGILLLLAYTLARTICLPLVLPVGILTSFMGAPLFLYLLLKERKMYW